MDTPILFSAGPAGSAASVRHDLRTPINAVIGYGEMLAEDFEDDDKPEASQTSLALVERGKEVLAAINKFDWVGYELVDSENVQLTELKGKHQARDTLLPLVELLVGETEQFLHKAEDEGWEEAVLDLEKIHNSVKRLLTMIFCLRKESGAETMILTRSPSTERPSGSTGYRDSSRNTQQLSASVRPVIAKPSGSGKVSFSAKGHILVVDDIETNRDVLSRYLTRQGHTVESVSNGKSALEALRSKPFDLVLLDIMMPEIDGFAVLENMLSDEDLRQIPVIMISALDEMGSIVRCIKLGAVDYLFKPFDPVLLQARIGACLERNAFYRAMLKTQKVLAEELASAAEYVKSLLPETLEGSVRANWTFIPSMQLGGDAFGYHWLDDNRFAVYLLDVCGHGVPAALLSVSAINVLRAQSLPKTDFGSPSSVLTGLNEAFQMDKHHGMFFTIWYGVFDKQSRKLKYATGGHPPAVLVDPFSGDWRELRTKSPIIGAIPGMEFGEAETHIPQNGRLYIFSDGVYEIKKPDGVVWTLGELEEVLAKPGDLEATTSGSATLNAVVDRVKKIAGTDVFEDDFSMVEVVLG